MWWISGIQMAVMKPGWLASLLTRRQHSHSSCVLQVRLCVLHRHSLHFFSFKNCCVSFMCARNSTTSNLHSSSKASVQISLCCYRKWPENTLQLPSFPHHALPQLRRSILVLAWRLPKSLLSSVPGQSSKFSSELVLPYWNSHCTSTSPVSRLHFRLD